MASFMGSFPKIPFAHLLQGQRIQRTEHLFPLLRLCGRTNHSLVGRQRLIYGNGSCLQGQGIKGALPLFGMNKDQGEPRVIVQVRAHHVAAPEIPQGQITSAVQLSGGTPIAAGPQAEILQKQLQIGIEIQLFRVLFSIFKGSSCQEKLFQPWRLSRKDTRVTLES